MRRSLLLCVVFLSLVSAVSATNYVLYPGENLSLDNYSLSFSYLQKSDAGFPSALRAYDAAMKINDTELISDALNDTWDALAEAKSDDVLYVKVNDRSLIVNYGGCKRLEQYNICFESVTYFEEDAKPLGDNRLDTVKVVAGETLLPFTVSITEAKIDIAATRSFTPTAVYPGELVTVKVSVLNTGAETATGVAIHEFPPFSVKKGETELFTGGLGENEQLLLTYTVLPQKPGQFTFSGYVDSSNTNIDLPDSGYTVLSPVQLGLTVPSVYLDEETTANFTLTNTYTSDITLTKITLSGTETYKLTKDGFEPKKSFSALTLGPQESYTTTLGFSGAVAGTHTVTGYVEYSLNTTKLSEEISTSYERFAPTLLLKPSFSGATAAVTIHNDGNDVVDGILITWSDGFSRDLSRLKAGSEVTVSHDFIGTEQAVTIRVTAPAQGIRAAFEQTVSGVVVPSEGSAVATPPEVAPTQPEQPPSEVPPAPPAEPAPSVDTSTATEADGGFLRSIIRGFVSFFDSLFN